MRTYAVILPPDDVRADVARALTEVGPLAPGVSWLPSDRLQVRLAYFGNLGQMETTAVRTTLTEISAWCPPLSLQLHGATAVPDPERAEEIALEMTGDVAELISLAQTIPPQVQRQGLFLDRRSFRARMTIASGGPFDARAVTAALATFESAAWTAEEMTLMRMLPGGADIPDVWEQVERYRFTATPDGQ